MSHIKSKSSCWLHGACNMQHIKIWLLIDDHSGCVYFESMKVSWRVQRLKWREASPQCIHRFTVNHTEKNIRENEEINRHRTPKAIVKHCKKNCFELFNTVSSCGFSIHGCYKNLFLTLQDPHETLLTTLFILGLNGVSFQYFYTKSKTKNNISKSLSR